MRFITAIFASAALASGLASDSTLPLLKLPYGTWRASWYNKEADVYWFRNIRYAAPPVGPLRFARPQPPQPLKGIQDGSYGHICPQKVNASEGLPNPSEDCLFLDVQVPAKALKSKKKDAAVIFIIHGGGYTGGNKGGNSPDDLINLAGIASKTNHNAILVSINYRLGVLGWLPGTEAQKANATNLGLHDQRAALEWVQKYIHLVGGNPKDVTAWGLSAGGGSILHHITQYGGRRDPLFRKAFVQSPGWFSDWDVPSIDKSFQDFAHDVGCSGVDTFACLRSANLSKIEAATPKTRRTEPVVDGDWITTTPWLAFRDGTYWKKLESVISTHVKLEIPWFLGNISTGEAFHAAMVGLFNDTETALRIEKQYPAPDVLGSPFATHKQRADAMISDYIFIANSVALADAYSGKSFAAIYAKSGALHASDVEIPYYSGTKPPVTNIDPELSLAYQSYFFSQVLTGDANTLRNKSGAPEWPRFSGKSATFLNVTDDGFRIVKDERLVSIVAFWTEIFVHLKKIVSSHS